MRIRTFILANFVSSLVAITSASGVKSCFYPDGTLSGDQPCNSTTTGHSSCCSAPCMSSGLCFDRGILSRGSCTDSSWKDSACPQYCTDFLQSSGCPIIPRQWLAVGDSDEVGWCCDFPEANGSCTQGHQVKVLAGYVLPNTTTTNSTTPGSAGSTSPPTCTGGHNVTNDGKCEANHDAAIGAGVGIPAAIAIASLLLLWLRERRIRKREVEKLHEVPLEKQDGKYQMQAETVLGVHNGYSGVAPVYPYEADGTARQTQVEADGTPRRNELP